MIDKRHKTIIGENMSWKEFFGLLKSFLNKKKELENVIIKDNTITNCPKKMPTYLEYTKKGIAKFFGLKAIHNVYVDGNYFGK